ncbi:MAG: DsbA family protein [Streptosporangiaceae bacterium]|jgi:protein-disulfide isomerase
MSDLGAPASIPAGATQDGDAIVIGDGAIAVDAFIDFLCPYCRKFEQDAGASLRSMVTGGQISVRYHPMSFLDEASTTRYSSRAAAASGCAADGGKFLEYAAALFSNQPPEGGPGLTDDELIELGIAAGLPAASFTPCVGAGRYLDWPPYVTARATALGVSATPTVLVAGIPVPAQARAIEAAVAAS